MPFFKAVCQYYLRGTCKFGSRCNNEHPPGREGSMTGGFGSQSASAASASAAPLAFNKDSIQRDLTLGQDRPNWPLSSFGAAKHEPNLIESLDQSPEELRLMYYDARQSGTLPNYITYEAQQIDNAGKKIALYMQDPRKTFDEAYAISPSTPMPPIPPKRIADTTTSSFGSTFGQPSSTPSTFGQTSAFGTPAGQSAFGQPSKLGATSSPFSAFGSSSGGFSAFAKPDQPSAFAQAAEGSQAQSAFGQPQSAFGQPQSAFGQPQSAFGNPEPSAFGQSASAFGQPTSAFGQSTSTFGQPQSAFGQPSQSAFGQAPSAFGQSTTTTTQPPSAFGQPSAATPSAFGQSAFGQSGSTTSAFGQPSPSASAFGQTSAFGTPSQPTSAFGSQSAFGQSSFAQGPAQSAFGQPTSAFGQSAFGTAGSSEVKSAFGNPGFQAQSTFGAPVQSAFGQNSTTGFGATAKSAGLRAPSQEERDDPYVVELPPNYIDLLPKEMRTAFEAEKFEWGKVPEWVPPVEFR